MTADKGATPWQADARFWATHLAVPLVVAVAVLTLLERSATDLWQADRWFALEGHRWALRDHWLTYDVIHHHGKQAIIGFGLVLLTLIGLSFRSARLKNWRMPLYYLLTSMVLLPALITRAKRYSPVPCPWDLTRYGGGVDYQHTFSYAPGITDFGHCFPSGQLPGDLRCWRCILRLFFTSAARRCSCCPG